MSPNRPANRPLEYICGSTSVASRMALYIAVLDGVVMDVIDVASQVVLIADQMFPESTLPDAAFAFLPAARIDLLAALRGPGKS